MLGDAPVLTAPLNAAWLRRKGIAGGTGLGDEWYDVDRTRPSRSDSSRPSITRGRCRTVPTRPTVTS